MNNANFSRARFYESSFKNANLEAADFSYTDLTAVDFTSADLSATNLSTAINSEYACFENARYNERGDGKTKFPKHFDNTNFKDMCVYIPR
jgi:uncharacterized protein YjbI with pentapeptide repeats